MQISEIVRNSIRAIEQMIYILNFGLWICSENVARNANDEKKRALASVSSLNPHRVNLELSDS